MRGAIETGFERSMGDEMDDSVRKFAIVAAVVGFFAHLSLWALDNLSLIHI